MRRTYIGGKGAKQSTIQPGVDRQFNMERASGHKNLYYDLNFTVNHDNAATITTDIYAFTKNIINYIEMITGADEPMFHLNTTEMLIAHLKEEGKLRYSIDTAIGAGKVSTFTLRWNFKLPSNFLNPLDTVFHGDDASKYNYVQINVKPQDAFTSVTDCTVNSVTLKISEKTKFNPTPELVTIMQDGKPVKAYTPPMHKKLLIKREGYNSDNSNMRVELPKNKNIIGIYAYVVDGDEVVQADAINNIMIKNGTKAWLNASFKEINEDNRDELVTWSNPLYDNIAFIDIAEGQIVEGLKTKQYPNTELEFDVVAIGATNILKVMFLIVEDA